MPLRSDALRAAADAMAELSEDGRRLRERVEAVRSDASPGMIAFQQRQAERIARANAKIAECDAFLVRQKNAARAIKKRGDDLHNGWVANSLRIITRTRSDYGLAINNISDVQKYDSWMANGDKQMPDAKEAVRRIEEQAASR